MASAPSGEALNRLDASAQVIARQAPFVTDPSVMSPRVVLIAPTGFEHGGQQALAQETQGSTVRKPAPYPTAFPRLLTPADFPSPTTHPHLPLSL